MHQDHRQYYAFTRRARIEKSINSLVGIVEGVSIDGAVNAEEVAFLRMWLEEHVDLRNRHPYNELMPVVHHALADGALSADERDDVLWLCERLRSTTYYDEVTADLQRLHAAMGGIAADGVIDEAELRGLAEWLSEREHLRTCWPYDEVCSLVTSVLTDKRVDEREHRQLKDFFTEFTAVLDERTIVRPSVAIENTIVGVCAVCPEIRFSGSVFCLTGASGRYTRVQFAAEIERLGGIVSRGVSSKTNYLVIGAEGNPCWAYACYGRKVETAVQLRKAGARLLLVHENDFHDAVADA